MSLCGNSARIVLVVGVEGRYAWLKHETMSILDLPFDEAEEARFDADAKIYAGKGVTHECVREWIWKLIKGERIPPSEA
jgi:hypothetical protein